MAICPVFDPEGPYVSNVLEWADCRILAFGADGYAALGPSSTYGAAWTGVLTILVALFAYRLLLTGTIALREAVIGVVKIGAVLALAGQWPAYRNVIYDFFTNAPSALTANLLAGARVGLNDLAVRVDNVNDAVADLIPPPPPPAALTQEGGAPQPQAPGTLSEKNQENIERASSLLTVTTLGGLVSVRLVSGILLGLGPLFLACLLFDASRGLFIGWLRGLIGAGLGAIAASLIVGMELAIIEPQVVMLGNLVASQQDAATLPTSIFATGVFFAILMLVVVAAVAKVSLALKIPTQVFVSNYLDARPHEPNHVVPVTQSVRHPEPVTVAALQAPSRARDVGSALQALDRREEQTSHDQVRMIRVGDTPAATGSHVLAVSRLGQSDRRMAPRKSTSADRRDNTK
jgi:type IV secretion system protein VirB6